MKSTRNYWPLGVFAVFALFFAGMTTVVVIATTHQDSLVSDNYYEQELKFQTQIDSAARARQCGAAVRVDAQGNQLLVSVPPAQLAEKFSGSIKFYRPSDAGLDREVALAPRPDGSQAVDISKLASGPWEVHMTWNAGGREYFLNEKITL